MKSHLLPLALIGLLSTGASAETLNGASYFIKAKALKEACVSMDTFGRGQGEVTNDGIFAAGRCYGAVLGFLDSITLQPMTSKGSVKGIEFCLPPEMDASDVAMKVASKITSMAAAADVPTDVADNAPAYILVREAARKEFPCSG